jgi:ectoine hydroxylase-related dioxygenase (phytanoyl-CoA dioxygenase family)
MQSENVDFLRTHGYVQVPAVLDPALAESVRDYADVEIAKWRELSRHDMFGNIQEGALRHDLKLPMSSVVREAVNQVIERTRPLFAALVGEEAELAELAVIQALPGARAQPVHADTAHPVTRFLQVEAFADDEDEETVEDLAALQEVFIRDAAVLCTALIPLQDTDESMGPTLVWPDTNTPHHHQILWTEKIGGKLQVSEADSILNSEHKAMAMKAGGMVLYDSCTIHCGGENRSAKKRTVLCMSFCGKGVRPEGSTYTLLKKLRHRYTVKSFPVTEDVCYDAPDVVEKEVKQEVKEVPDLQEWRCTVQCKRCNAWRPVDEDEGARFTCDERFECASVGFSCSQPQRYTAEEIDAWINADDESTASGQ